jgi:catechol 2,3-dioxygenase-like lactoylglutathione lyase family enzyme
MKLKRFEHINLSCQNLDATKKFYLTLFPDWYVRAEDKDDESHWVHLGDDQFYLALNDNPSLNRVHELYENIGVNHVGFVIDDGEAMKALLDQHGIEYYMMTAPETKYRIYVNDPDGNEIELVEYNQDYQLR